MPGRRQLEDLPSDEGGEVFRELTAIEIEDGAKFVIVGGMTAIDKTKYTPVQLEWRRTEPIEGSLRKYLKRGFPARLYEVKELVRGSLYYIRHKDAHKRFMIEGDAVIVSGDAEVLERERAYIEEHARRSEEEWIAFLLIGTLVAVVGGFFLLFFIWFIGTLFKEVF